MGIPRPLFGKAPNGPAERGQAQGFPKSVLTIVEQLLRNTFPSRASATNAIQPRPQGPGSWHPVRPGGPKGDAPRPRGAALHLPPKQQPGCTSVRAQEGSDSRVCRGGRNQQRRHLLGGRRKDGDGTRGPVSRGGRAEPCPRNAPGMRVCTPQPVLEGRRLRGPSCRALRGPMGDAERGARPLSALLLGTGPARGSPQRRFGAR